jgi:hypothetical protein
MPFALSVTQSKNREQRLAGSSPEENGAKIQQRPLRESLEAGPPHCEQSPLHDQMIV